MIVPLNAMPLRALYSGLTIALGVLAAGPSAERLAMGPEFPSGPSCAPLPLEGRLVRVSTVAELTAAIANMASGDTVLIARGTYRLENTLHLHGGLSRVAIRGESGLAAEVVLQGRGMANESFGNVPHGFLVADVSDVLIADLTVRDVYYHAVQVAGEYGPARIRLHNVHLIDAGEQLVKGSTAGPPGPYADDGVVECSLLAYTDRARSYYTNGVDILAGKDWVIRDNVFRNIRAPVGALAGPAVLLWRNTIDSVVERNWFIDCDRGIALGLSDPDPRYARDGEARYDHQGGVVRNNMVWRTAGSPTGDVGITANFARDFRILHNTVVLNGTFPWGAIEYRFGASNGEIRANLTDAPIWQRDGAQATLSDNLDGAQAGWFTAAATVDLHLSRGSPPVDAVGGSDDTTDDIDGQARPAMAAPDAGADEWWPEPEESATPMSTASPTPTSTVTSTSASNTSVPSTPTSTPSGSPTLPTGSTLTPDPLFAIFVPSIFSS